LEKISSAFLWLGRQGNTTSTCFHHRHSRRRNSCYSS